MVVDVPVAPYVPAACGDATGALVTYTGLGDFAQTSAASQVAPLGASGVALTQLPTASREIVLTPAGGAADAGAWAGAALVPDAGAVEILTLPVNRACPLSSQVPLAGDPGASIGMIDGSHAILLGETYPPFVVDFGTGAITQLPASLSLTPPRDYATITPFGSGALIAGGQDPTTGGEPQSTFVVYTPGPGGAPGSFGSLVQLRSGDRTHHAAVALADGRVLLVGGTSGASQALLTDIDVLEPAAPPVVTQLVKRLHVGRTLPTVLALPDGEVFIGGGLDASGNPVASVEWLKPDLTWGGMQTLCSVAAGQGFAATEGGAVLAVFATTATPGCSNVHLLRSSGVEDAPPLDPPPGFVRLFAGAQASPVLMTGASAALRWNPWTATFTSLGPGSLGLSSPTTAFLSATPGLAAWLGEDSNVWTLRFDTHGPYATDFAHGDYLLTDDEFTAPDRLPGPDVSFAVDAGASLSNGASVWLTDATFAAVTLSVVLPEGGAASVLLRDPSGYQVVCSVAGAPPLGSIQVVRSGASVSVSGAGSGGCTGARAADARVALGLAAPPGGTSHVRNLAVERQ